MITVPLSEVVASARAAGIVRIVTVGTDLESSRWSARCADEHDGVYAAVAIHPNETQAVSAEVGTGAPAPGSPAAAEVLAQIEALARLPRVVAVGETGLDYYRHHAGPDVQRWWFREHITIAKRTGKALMIHDREAHADVLRILEARRTGWCSTASPATWPWPSSAPRRAT
jgi:TatD DNase family protein